MAGPTFRTSSGSSRGERTVVGRLFVSLFMLAFLGLGVGFCVLLGRSFLDALRTYSWPESSCRILSSGVEENPGAADAEEAYRLQVRFSYSAGGAMRQGDTYRPGYTGSSDITATRGLAAAYPPGADVRCFVDPADPLRAFLVRPRLWVGIALLLPLLFVGVGAVGLVSVWRRPARSSAASSAGAGSGSGPGAALSGSAAEGRGALGCLIAFFGIFFLVGAGTLLFFVLPALKAAGARNWRETPCTVLHSQVRTHSGSDSNTYSVDVLYTYVVDDRRYESNRYQFLGGSSSGYDGKAEIVARYPPGTRTVCYVDPADPTQAVLHRGLSADYWVALVPLVFLLVGAGGMYGVARSGRMHRRRDINPDLLAEYAVGGISVAGARARELAADAVAAGPVVLKPKMSPFGKLVGFTLVALFWNGIVSVFVWQAVKGWRAGAGDGCLTLFLVPFVLIGLALLASVPYQFLALFNPRLTLTLERRALPLGSSTAAEWRFSGWAGRIRRLTFTLEGTESATYRRGTSSTTDSHTFTTLELFATDLAAAIAAGSFSIAVPRDTMHSFAARHNKIVWTLKAHGEIARWPDVSEEYEIEVLPAAGAAGSGFYPA